MQRYLHQRSSVLLFVFSCLLLAKQGYSSNVHIEPSTPSATPTAHASSPHAAFHLRDVNVDSAQSGSSSSSSGVAANISRGISNRRSRVPGQRAAETNKTNAPDYKAQDRAGNLHEYAVFPRPDASPVAAAVSEGSSAAAAATASTPSRPVLSNLSASRRAAHADLRSSFPAVGPAATAAAPAAAAAPISSTRATDITAQAACTSAALRRRKCAECNAKVNACSRCIKGYQLMKGYTTKPCTIACCNMIPVPNPKLSYKVRAQDYVDIDFTKGAKDERVSKLKAQIVQYKPTWGSGQYMVKSGVKYRFFAAKLPGLPKNFTLNYTLVDTLGAKAMGAVTVQILGNTPPTAANGILGPVRAGWSVTYTTFELLQALSATDIDRGDVLRISKASLKATNRGDRLKWVDDGHLSYMCPSAELCASMGGNTIQVTVSDGEGTVTAGLQQPVKPRPTLEVFDPIALQTSDNLGNGRPDLGSGLQQLGYTLLPVTIPQGLGDQEQLPGDMLDVYLEDGTLEAVEFEPDLKSDKPAALTTASLPLRFAGLDPNTQILSIRAGDSGTARRRPLQQQTMDSTDSSSGKNISSSSTSSSTANATGAAVVQPADYRCDGCMITEEGFCTLDTSDPFAGLCDEGHCIAGMYGYCVDDGSSCASCTISDYGDCVDVEGSTGCSANNCYLNDIGNCVQGAPQGSAGSQVYGWLIPPVKTTAIGFWAGLGCETSGSVIVEFDVVNDEEEDVVDVKIKHWTATAAAAAEAGALLMDDQAASKGTLDTILDLQDPQKQRTGRHLSRRFLTVQNQGTTAQSGGKPSATAAAAVTPHQMHDWIGRADDACYGRDTASGFSSTASSNRSTTSARNAKGSTNAATASSSSYNMSRDSVKIDSASTAEVILEDLGTGTRRRLLSSMRESEGVGLRCPFYSRTVEATQDVPVCVAEEQQVQGIWFAAHVTGGYIRQVRLETSVSENSDPSIYLTGIVISQTKP